MRVPFSEADVTKFSLQRSKLLTGVMPFWGSLSVSIPKMPLCFLHGRPRHMPHSVFPAPGRQQRERSSNSAWLMTLNTPNNWITRAMHSGLGAEAQWAECSPSIHKALNSHVQRALSSVGKFAHLMINHDKPGLRKPRVQSPLHIPGIVGHTCNSNGGSRKIGRSRPLSATQWGWGCSSCTLNLSQRATEINGTMC